MSLSEIIWHNFFGIISRSQKGVLPGYAAVFVNYTRSPEAQYPTAISEAFAATRWVTMHGREINVDPNRLAIVGNSVGGNMTAVIALMAKAKGGPAIQCQVMFWPVTDANLETESYNQYAKVQLNSASRVCYSTNIFVSDSR